MFIRVLSAMVGLLILLVILFTGGPLLYICAFVVTGLGFFEYYRSQKSSLLFLIFNSVAFGMMMLDMLFLNDRYLLAIFVIYLLTLLTVSLLSDSAQKQVANNALGFLYVGLPMFTILKIYHMDHRFIWYVFLISFMTDTFAFFSGTYLGKHKLLPHISPKKTIEGSIGGTVGCMISGVVYSYLFFPELMISTIPIVIIGSIFGQVGDLVASKFKREADVKDFGTIMPGHGGMLDRFDSILFVAPVLYLYLLMIG